MPKSMLLVQTFCAVPGSLRHYSLDQANTDGPMNSAGTNWKISASCNVPRKSYSLLCAGHQKCLQQLCLCMPLLQAHPRSSRAQLRPPPARLIRNSETTYSLWAQPGQRSQPLPEKSSRKRRSARPVCTRSAWRICQHIATHCCPPQCRCSHWRGAAAARMTVRGPSHPEHLPALQSLPL